MYILIGFLYLGNWEAGGVITQEFTSMSRCEAARVIIENRSKEAVPYKPTLKSIGLMCVEK